MEEFFPEWNWNKAAVTNYGGLGLGTVDTSEDQFDIELDEILKEYNDLSGENKEGDSIPDQDDPLYDSAVSSVATECIPDQFGDISTAAVTPEPVLDPKLEKIAGLSSLVEELSDELEILLFYHRKCYIKNLSNSNYLRQTPVVPFSQVSADFKRKFKTPYIAAQTENGALAVPSSDCGQKQFPFLHERTHEWKPSDLHKLEMCVINSFYHRQLFLIDGRFQQMMFKMGFTAGDLSQIHSGKQEMDKELWNVFRTDRIPDHAKIEKYQHVLHRFMGMEIKLIEELVAQHERDKRKIVPLIVTGNGGKSPAILARIDLKDLIAWRQHEAKRLYLKRIYHEGAVDIKNVDWLMVEKDVFFLSGRTESAEELKKIYRFCKSSEFNNDYMSGKELNNLKLVINTQLHSAGIDWTNIAKQLGTNRSPIRIFQTYKNFICRTETNTFLRNYNDKLSAFLHIKKYVGHVPRIVSRLQQKFGPVNYVTFGATWQEVNPRFAIGNFFVAEDAALLIAMELRREALCAGRKFSILQSRLPWRHCNIWRKRAANLFWNYDKWTFEEDQLLLFAGRKYGVEWNGLPKLFPNRPKYAVIVRYHLLRKKIGAGITLSQYHSIYYRRMTKSNLILLLKVANLLRRVLGEPLQKKGHEEVPDISGNIDLDDDNEENSDDEEMWMALSSNKTELGPIRVECHPPTALFTNCISTNAKPPSSKSSFELDCDSQNLELLKSVLSAECETLPRQLQPLQDVSDWKTPTQINVLHYLTTFDKNIVRKALQRLEAFIYSQGRVEKSINSPDSSKSSKLVVNCDRRRFFPDDPISVASALHLRRVELRPITSEIWQRLNEFEKTVCHAIRAYSSSWKTKKGAKRPSIPSGISLTFLPSIRNIIKYPKEIAADLPITSGALPPPDIIKQERYVYEEMFPATGRNNNYEANTSIGSETEIINNDELKPEVEVVPPTSTMLEARNGLCRTVYNNNNSVKARKRSTKMRRKALNHAAARARWEKQIAKDKEAERLKNERKNKEKMPKRIRWYDVLLSHSGVDYEGGFEHLLCVDEDVCWEDTDGVTGGPVLLTVLHDHCYAKGYVPVVQNVVDDIRSTFSKLHGDESGDSAKENENVQIELKDSL